MLRCMLIAGAIGAATELTARTLSLWIYRQPLTPVINVIVMFGVIMGGLAGLAPSLGTVATFVIAFGVGLAYEIANLRVLDWWYFPGERLWIVAGHARIVVVIAVLWGFVPLMAAAVSGVLST